MWRKLAFVIPSVVILGVGAPTIEVTDLVHRHQAQDRAVQTREAQQLAATSAVLRWQMLAIEDATSGRDAAQRQLDAAQSQLATVSAERDKLKDQVAALQAVSYGLGAGPAAFTVGATAGPVAFPWGYCTWYVASRRLVTWRGNAIDWWWNARGIRPEGSQPQVGAIQVSRDSWWGHVALVEAVNGNGSWVVSEMNYVAWGYIDRRTVWPGGTLVGFIY